MKIKKIELELRVFAHGRKHPISLTFHGVDEIETGTVEDAFWGIHGLILDDLMESMNHQIRHLDRKEVPGCRTCRAMSRLMTLAVGGAPWKRSASAARRRRTPKVGAGSSTTRSARRS